jgi:hypothetical protein
VGAGYGTTPVFNGHGGGQQTSAATTTLGGQVEAATRSIGARCAELVDALPIPSPFSMDLLLRRLADQRGKPIQLSAAALDPHAPCGVLISTKTVDFVCYADHTSPLHRQHIILHEIGHLVFDHEGHRITLTDDPSSSSRGSAGATQRRVPDAVEQLMPYLDPSGIRRLLNRSVYHAPDEREAELFATLAGDRISRLLETPRGAAPRDLAQVRLRALFDVPAPRGVGHRG